MGHIKQLLLCARLRQRQKVQCLRCLNGDLSGYTVSYVRIWALTSAEFALLDKFDPGDLYRFQQARELSIELLEQWLSRYKFKDWTRTESRGLVVTDEMRKERAKTIGKELSNYTRWRSHGRGISMKTLTEEINLKIEDLAESPDLAKPLREYFGLIMDYVNRQQLLFFMHSKEYF